MGTTHIENPEVGRTYLIRRKISGNPSTRFQPAQILSVEQCEATPTRYAGKYISVRWLFDQAEEHSLVAHYGSVKELTKKWLNTELNRGAEELRLARMKIGSLQHMIFVEEAGK